MRKSQTPVQGRGCQSGPIFSTSMRGDFQRIVLQTNNDCRFQILNFDQFTTSATFACWKIRFKTEVCICSQFPTEAMLWIKEVEMVESVDDLKSSRSIRGIHGPDFEILDARIVSALNRIIQNTRFKRKVSLEEMKKLEKKAASSEEDISLIWSTSISGSLEPMIVSRIMLIYLQLFFEMMIFRNSIRNGTEFYYPWRKSHLMTSSKDCTNWEYESLRNSRPYWTCTTWTFITRKLDFILTDWRQCEQNLRMKNFEARSGNYERNNVVKKNEETKQREQRTRWDCWQWKSWLVVFKKGDNCIFRHDMNKRAESTQPNPPSISSTQQNVKMQREPEVPEAEAQVENGSTAVQGLFQRNLHQSIICKKWHFPECLFYKSENGCRFGEQCSHAHRQVDEQQCKKSQKEWWQKCSG